MNTPLCGTCMDTHRMQVSGLPCTRCPIPCEKCRTKPQGAYCEKTPCECVCHQPKVTFRKVEQYTSGVGDHRMWLAWLDAFLAEHAGKTVRVTFEVAERMR